jgi:hypothetical protein
MRFDNQFWYNDAYALIWIGEVKFDIASRVGV